MGMFHSSQEAEKSYMGGDGGPAGNPTVFTMRRWAAPGPIRGSKRPPSASGPSVPWPPSAPGSRGQNPRTGRPETNNDKLLRNYSDRLDTWPHHKRGISAGRLTTGARPSRIVEEFP